MSKSADKASAEEQDEQKNDSVFDFLYCDTRRIGSFLAQFDDAGHLQQVIERETANKSTKRAIKLNLGGGGSIAGTGAQGNIGIERGPAAEGSEASERVYDPLWTNARTLLDYLTNHDMIQRNISRARIGEFVLASGSLEVRDLKLIQKVLELFVQSQNETARVSDNRNRSKNWQQRHAAEQVQQQTATNNQLAVQVLTLLPHAVHALINKEDDWRVWCSLKVESLVMSLDDILLKHGVSIPGKWYVLGVLDALPDGQSRSCGQT